MAYREKAHDSSPDLGGKGRIAPRQVEPLIDF